MINFLDTLASVQPTLAVLAFQSSRTAIAKSNACSANPSTLYCNQLGGTAAGDTPSSYLPFATEPVGWWTHKNSSWYGINDFCVFADGSAIDTWTMFYHAISLDRANNIQFAYKPPASSNKLL